MTRQRRTPLPSTAGAVVIGGGVIGASVAYHLAKAGVRDVLVVERAQLGSGSSGKPIGGVRAQFSDPLNVQLAAKSLAAYERFPQTLGADINLQQVGYLFLLREQDQLERFASAAALQARFGVENRMVDPTEAHALCPLVDPDSVIGAAYSPKDGHARPDLVIAAYVGAARALGASITGDCAVQEIEVVGGEIAAVLTSRGRVRTSTVVCATGAWSRDIGAMVDVELDVVPLRRQIAFTGPTALREPQVPFTIDYDSTFYFHAANDGFLMGMSDSAQAPGFDRQYDAGWLPGLRAAANRCAPALAQLEIEYGWAGLYEQTPDANALIGQSHSVSNFLYAAGFSGHGFCLAPATGEIIADLACNREPFVDVRPLRAERFIEQSPIVESNIV